MAEIRAALPQFRAALMARWPIVTGIQIENRRITRRQNPFNPAQAAMDATIGIVIVFFFEAAKAAGKKAGDATGNQIVEIIEAVKGWIQERAYTTPTRRPKATRKRLVQPASSRKVKKKARRPSRN